MKKIFITALFLLGLGLSFTMAQQQAMYSQYMFNMQAVNPAYVGIHKGLSLNANYRNQWTGIEGAPTTQTVSAHSPILGDRLGVGLLLLNDKIGAINQTGAYFQGSYKVPLTNGARLSFGLQVGLNSYRANWSELGVFHNNDPLLQGNEQRGFRPNFGTGVMYYTDNYYLGISVPVIMGFGVRADDIQNTLIEDRHYFITGGYVFDINESVKFKPHFLVKLVESAPTQFNLNASLLIQEKVWAGLSYRSQESFSAIFQIQMSDRLRVSYSYDFMEMNALGTIGKGSHEVGLNFFIANKKVNISNPRYF